MKDNFSQQPGNYVRYRPTYPAAFFTYLQRLLPRTENAWDCATGNGQAAQKLALFFQQVYATDSSPAQLANAVQLPNIHYTVQPAEKTNFPACFFDLVLAAQAVHWFDFAAFYAEAQRTGRAGALLVVLGYGRLCIEPAIDEIIKHFYTNIIRPYWDDERRYIDEGYQTIPFPFEELNAPAFAMEAQWTPDHLLGYLQTWSAVQHYQQKNGVNPVAPLADAVRKSWGKAGAKTVRFPLLLRIGRLHKK